MYYGTVSGTYLQPRGAGIDAGASTSYAVTGLTSGNQYYFAVTALDVSGQESPFSVEATKFVP